MNIWRDCSSDFKTLYCLLSGYFQDHQAGIPMRMTIIFFAIVNLLLVLPHRADTQSPKSNRTESPERPATEEERKAFLATHQRDCLVFPEDRSRPIRMRDALPFRWIQKDLAPYVEGITGRNEYYTFQLGVLAARTDLHNTRVVFDDLLEKNGQRIPASRLTCFAADSANVSAIPFPANLHTLKGTILPLWIGVDLSGTIRPGSYAGSMEVRSDGIEEEVLLIRLIVRDTLYTDRGDSEPWRRSQLRFLIPVQREESTKHP